MNKKHLVILAILMAMGSTTVFGSQSKENNSSINLAGCNGECQNGAATLGDGDIDK